MVDIHSATAEIRRGKKKRRKKEKPQQHIMSAFAAKASHKESLKLALKCWNVLTEMSKNWRKGRY